MAWQAGWVDSWFHKPFIRPFYHFSVRDAAGPGPSAVSGLPPATEEHVCSPLFLLCDVQGCAQPTLLVPGRCLHWWGAG